MERKQRYEPRIRSKFLFDSNLSIHMAFRFGNYRWVKQGTLDNRVAGRTVGTLDLAVVGKVLLELDGDMQGALRGKLAHFQNPEYDPAYVFDHGPYTSTAEEYMDGFSSRQQGDVGDILGEPYFYLEWYSRANGRCVVELDGKYCHAREATGGAPHVE